MANDQGRDIAGYKLPVIDTCKQLRNFPGYKEEVLTMADIEEAMEGGTTDTSPGAEQRNDPNEMY